MNEAVSRYLLASTRNDMETLMSTLAEEAEVISPISGRMVFRGHGDLRILLGAVYGGVTGLRWDERVVDGQTEVAIGKASIGPFGFTDAMAFDLNDRGQISRVRPHLRPWLGLTALALRLGPKLARLPGVIARALRRP